MFDFVWHYALPVTLFLYCYGRIFQVIRRQKKIFGNQMVTDRTQVSQIPRPTMTMVSVTAMPRHRSAGNVQQQTTAPTSVGRMSRKEWNVVQTMIVVTMCFIVCWTPASIANIVQSLTVRFSFLYCNTDRMVHGGRVIRCRTCDREVAGSNPALSCCVPTPTQRAIPPGSVNEYQRKLGAGE